VTCVIYELFENRNNLNLISSMISIEIFVALKLKKRYEDKLWPLLNVVKKFSPLDFSYLYFHHYEKYN
jgi:hypothetical protein